MSNPNILTSDDLIEITGHTQIGTIEKKLRDEGVRPFPGKNGKFFITISQLEAARGIFNSVTPINNSDKIEV